MAALVKDESLRKVPEMTCQHIHRYTFSWVRDRRCRRAKHRPPRSSCTQQTERSTSAARRRTSCRSSCSAAASSSALRSGSLWPWRCGWKKRTRPPRRRRRRRRCWHGSGTRRLPLPLRQSPAPRPRRCVLSCVPCGLTARGFGRGTPHTQRAAALARNTSGRTARKHFCVTAVRVVLMLLCRSCSRALTIHDAQTRMRYNKDTAS